MSRRQCRRHTTDCRSSRGFIALRKALPKKVGLLVLVHLIQNGNVIAGSQQLSLQSKAGSAAFRGVSRPVRSDSRRLEDLELACCGLALDEECIEARVERKC